MWCDSSASRLVRSPGHSGGEFGKQQPSAIRPTKARSERLATESAHRPDGELAPAARRLISADLHRGTCVAAAVGASDGGTQVARRGPRFLVATHSPIIMAYPQALIYWCSEMRVGPVAHEGTEYDRVTKAFLSGPAK